MALTKSWVETANSAEGQFPLNNLPYGVFLDADGAGSPCVAIGDMIVDLAVLEDEGLIDAGGDAPVFDVPFLNEFMELGPDAWASVRARLTDLLAEGGDDALSSNADLRDASMIAQADVQMAMPFVVGEYTDFYAGRHHATNVGTMFRGK